MSTFSAIDPSQRIRLDDQVIIVTGANGGLGRGIVERLVAGGALVVAQTRRLWSPPIGIADSVAVVQGDLRDPEVHEALLAAADNGYGGLNGLVNNAGIQPVVPYESITAEQWREVLEVNLTAAHLLTQAVCADLKRRRVSGSVVNIASIEARQPTLLHGHYAAAKAGLVMQARAAALTYGPADIRVNTILPGLVERDGIADDWPEGVERWHARAPLGRMGTPGDIGDACVFLCSDMASWITGAELVVDGGVLTNPTW